MILIKYRDGQGDIRLMPDREEDKSLFYHCTNGRWSCLNREFNKMIWPVLNAHGIHHVQIIDKVKPRSYRK